MSYLLIVMYFLIGRPETTEEAVKSKMAIYLYRRKIEDLKHHVDPADFKKNLYQPERDASGELIIIERTTITFSRE